MSYPGVLSASWSSNRKPSSFSSQSEEKLEMFSVVSRLVQFGNDNFKGKDDK